MKLHYKGMLRSRERESGVIHYEVQYCKIGHFVKTGGCASDRMTEVTDVWWTRYGLEESPASPGWTSI